MFCLRKKAQEDASRRAEDEARQEAARREVEAAGLDGYEALEREFAEGRDDLLLRTALMAWRRVASAPRSDLQQ